MNRRRFLWSIAAVSAAAACSALAIKAKSPIIVAAKPLAADPYDQIAQLGWKCWHKAAILNENWISQLEAA